MKTLILSALALLGLVGSALSEEPPLVILLGDSIRMNYQDVVREQLKGEAELWSPDENCRHTAFVLETLEKWLEGRDPEVIHTNVGLHDMYLNEKTGQPRHTLDVYGTNLRAIFTRLKETDAQIIFALTTAVDEDRQPLSNYNRVVRRNSDVDRYNAKARDLAAEFGIQVNDLNAFMKDKGAAEILTTDGIHLSEAGKVIMGKQVAAVIQEALGNRS